MAATIAVVSDTHCLDWEEVHPDIRSALSEADFAVHCGDFTRMSVVEGLRRVARKAVMVHGNSDPIDQAQGLLPWQLRNRPIRALCFASKLHPPGGPESINIF